jgi:hypothetical protein
MMEDLDKTNAANNNDAVNVIDDEPAVQVQEVISPVVAEQEIVPPVVALPPPPAAPGPAFFTRRKPDCHWQTMVDSKAHK